MRKKMIISALLIMVWSVFYGFSLDIPAYSQAVSTLPLLQNPGEPAVPYLKVPCLLEMGQKVTSLEVIFTGESRFAADYIPPAQEPYPLSAKSTAVTPEKQSIYNNADLYPANDFINLGTQRHSGYEVLYIHLYPWHYNPLKEEVSWQTQAEINIYTVADHNLKEEQNRFLLSGKELPKSLDEVYFRQNSLSYSKQNYRRNRNLPDPDNPYSSILITSESAIDWFMDFLIWKGIHNQVTASFYVEDIYEEYDGANNQEKIKNFIIDAYETWSSTDLPLEYVILGGDDEIIPIRGVYINAGGTEDENMPCDLYYSCLDNNWDENGNGIYGEIEDNADLVPEVAISRLPFDNAVDAANWYHKITHYVDDNTYSNNITYMLGEFLWGNPDTWGGDSMDLLLEVFDEPYHINTMYQRDGTYSEYGVMQAINNGLGFINHLGHANEFFVFGQNRVNAAAYTNTEYGFAYTQGCYPAAFDESTGQSGECIAENFIIRPGGLFGFIGNSRYGWGIPGQPANGPSQQYHLPFIQAIFDLDMREFGNALAYSREVMVDGALADPFLRWVHYELTLMGDPAVSLKEPEPDFPFLYPQQPVYYDITGDGDGAINPGETIEIEIPLTADFDWADAVSVYALISFSDPTLSADIDSVFYGDINAGETVSTGTFLVTVPEDCSYDAYPYEIEVFAEVNPESQFMKSYSFDFEVSLQQAFWPWILSERLSVAPIICDVDNDDQLDILASTMSGNIYPLDLNAQLITPQPWLTGETIEKHTASADIDNDTEPELILATRGGNIYARNMDGSLQWQYNHEYDQLLTPVLADIDGDQLLETLSLGMDGNLLALDEDGEMETGFPIVLNQLVFQEMAAADFDGDGAAEIAVASQNAQLHIFNADGSELNGFPLDLPAVPSSGIVILDNNILALSAANQLLLVSPQGEILLTKDITSSVVSAPIAADFDNDGELDLAFSTQFGSIYICRQDGSDLPGWPQSLCTSISQPPLAVDLDNDNCLEIIWFSSANTLYVYNHDGSEVPFSPVPMNFNDNFPASVKDIDNDNDFEIVFSTSNRVIIIDSKLPAGERTPWTTYRGNLRRTAFYGDNQTVDVLPDEIIPQNILTGNYPNPFNPQTTIKFHIAEPADKADISIYNIKGQKVYSRKFQQLSSGEHYLIWNGQNSSTNSVTSGIYFYRLSLDGNICDTRKMLLLK